MYSEPERLLELGREAMRGFRREDREVVIRVEDLSKRYHTGNLFPTLRDFLRSPGRNPFTFLRRYRKEREFYALDHVSFEVRRGEVVGLIGQNGSGKSTTLTLLARITAPTAGRIECRGRVSTLIQVGAGFNPELTGRENVYLNGAILGLPTRRIDEKFDEIVSFAELEKFIDTPVKWYSAGMYVRLGFAVAVALDPEILLVDEVLAVGDAAFRAKSMAKMLSFAQDRNVTILFVSHHMRAVAAICDRVIWLHAGKILADGPTEEVIERYNAFLSGKEREQGQGLTGVSLAPGLSITAYKLLDARGNERYEYEVGEPLRVRAYYRAERRIERPYVTFAVFNRNGHLMVASNLLDEKRPECLEGEGYLEAEFERLDLMPGRYQTMGILHDRDGVTMLTRDLFMPSFTIVTPPEKLGWTGKFAPSMVATANCTLSKYRWRFGKGG